MINELTILNKMKEVIGSQLNNHLDGDIPKIDEKNVTIDFPEVDLMPKNIMFYLQPNYSSYENMTTEGDSSTFTISVFIICKKDKQENLTKKVYHYFNSLYDLLRKNITLDDTVDFVDIESADYFPAVEGNRNVQAIEMLANVRYTKEW